MIYKEQINVRVSEETFNGIKMYALEENMSLSSAIRHFLKQATKPKKKKPKGKH